MLLAEAIPTRRPASFTDAVSSISPFSEIVLSSCRTSFGNSVRLLPYSARLGWSSLSVSKNTFRAPKACMLAFTCISSSTSSTLPMRARFTGSAILYRPPKGKRLPSFIIRRASAVSICIRFTVSKSEETGRASNRSLPRSVAAFSAASIFTFSNSSVLTAKRPVVRLFIKKVLLKSRSLTGTCLMFIVLT